MDTPLDGALLAQALSSKLCVSHAEDGPATGDRGAREPTPRLPPDEGRTPIPFRTRLSPRISRTPRPTSRTIRPRAAWTWHPGTTLVRPRQISRRQSPGRFRGLSRSISPRRTLADYRYRDLLQEALLSEAVPVPGFQVNVVPVLSVHELWPDECGISTSQFAPGMVPLEAAETTAPGETTDEEAQEVSDDYLLDEIDQQEEPHLDPSHRLWGIKDCLAQHAQTLSSQSHTQESQKTQCPRVYACPFFRKDPKRYYPCLADTSTAIQGVKRHLWRFHSQPYYCPVCYGTFPLASGRDRHIMERACEKREVRRVEGMTPEQKSLVLAGCGGSGVELWRGIWGVLFGRTGVFEPFLQSALARDVTTVVGFWKTEGREITEEFLAGMEMSGDGDDAVSALVDAVLKDLVGQAFWRSGMVLGPGTMGPWHWN